VIHVSNPPDFLVIAALPSAMLGARLIFDVHDLSPDMFAMRFGRVARFADPVLRRLERFACRRADVVLTVHEQYADELVRRGSALNAPTVVMNAVDDELLAGLAKSSPTDRLRVIYHGTITRHYGVDLLVRAFARLAAATPTAELEILGEGDAVPELQSLVDTLGISDRVTISGRYLPHCEALARVAGASVGVIPNRPTTLNRYALSSKLFEYVALRVAVVSADLPTIRAHFSPEEIVLFEPGNDVALSEALANVLGSPEASAMRTEAAFQRLAANYKWSHQAARYVRALRDLTDA
jgi:glycosyltransferase involved in cell wall biosynthesis